MRDIAILLADALGRRLAPDERLAVAVSGGPDSVALLLLAAAAFPGRVAAITVDHGLRAAAAAEAADVAAQCRARGIPHATLEWTGDKPAANLQAAARAARYSLMTAWCAANGIGILLTAHHADDQAETMLMRLARGSGAGGLAGIRARRDLGNGVVLARPMLGVRRADLATVIADSGWTPASDPSNHNPRYARTHARRLLATTDWLNVPRIAQVASNLADVEAALAWTTDFAWAGRAVVAADSVELDSAGLPVELVRRLTARAIAALAPLATLRGTDIARLIARLDTAGTATIAGVRVTGGATWGFSLAPTRRNLAKNDDKMP